MTAFGKGLNNRRSRTKWRLDRSTVSKGMRGNEWLVPSILDRIRAVSDRQELEEVKQAMDCAVDASTETKRRWERAYWDAFDRTRE